jgi:NAD-dependent DNA ligase
MDQLLSLKEEADDAYFNSESPIMSDNEYDILCQILEGTKPTIGCLPRTDKVKLPVHMGSLTKYNDEKSLNLFLEKFNHKSFNVQEKLDGVSCLYVRNSDGEIRLYTRGNGTLGTDITHLLISGLKIPHVSNYKRSFMVRGELIMSKKIFEEKYSHDFKNIRNMVSGQLSKKNPNNDIIRDLDFVAYEVIESESYQKSVVEQYRFLNTFNFKVVYNRIITRDYLKQKVLMDYLNRRKEKSKYQIDGLVITITKEYIRNDCDNPKYSFAFKIQGEVVDGLVECVKWNLSKNGKYKPQIFIKPVNLNGVTISSLTGFNAKYILENKIKHGSILAITRSGDVIPHIVAILKKGDGEIELPKQSVWNSVDLYHNSITTPDEVTIKKMVYFFTSLNCLNCKEKTILKIYNFGYKTIESIIQAKVDDLTQINGIGNVLATKLSTSIQTKVREASTHELLAALNSFGEGIGLKKILNINLNCPENLDVKGLSPTTLKEKVLPVWEESLNRVKNIKKLVGIDHVETDHVGIDHVDGPLCYRIFVFTGFRDSFLEKQIIDLGGRVTTSVSKKTTDLIVANLNSKSSSKLLKSKQLGIKISTKSEILSEIETLVLKPKEIEYDHYTSSEEE